MSIFRRKNSQVLGFSKSIVDSMMKLTIFSNQKDSFLMFSILLWIKDVEEKIQIFEAFLLFPEFLKRRKITHTKYLIFDKTAKLKCEITLWGQTFARRKFCEVKQSWIFIGLTFTNDLLQLISQQKKQTFVIEEQTYFASNKLSRLVKTFLKNCLLLK